MLLYVDLCCCMVLLLLLLYAGCLFLCLFACSFIRSFVCLFVCLFVVVVVVVFNWHVPFSRQGADQIGHLKCDACFLLRDLRTI